MFIFFPLSETQETKIDPTIYNTEDEENEDFLLQFEKYVSEQEVSFFSQKMDFSKIFFLYL